MSNHMFSRVWDEITNQFAPLNFGLDKQSNFTFYSVCSEQYMLGLKLIRIDKIYQYKYET